MFLEEMHACPLIRGLLSNCFLAINNSGKCGPTRLEKLTLQLSGLDDISRNGTCSPDTQRVWLQSRAVLWRRMCPLWEKEMMQSITHFVAENGICYRNKIGVSRHVNSSVFLKKGKMRRNSFPSIHCTCGGYIGGSWIISSQVEENIPIL